MKLSKAEVTHLRLLLGWMRCDYGNFQSPDEIRETWKDLAAHGVIPDAHNGSRERLMAHYNLSEDVPKYIRHSLKMLTQSLRAYEKLIDNGEVVAESVTPEALDAAVKRLNDAAVKLIGNVK